MKQLLLLALALLPLACASEATPTSPPETVEAGEVEISSQTIARAVHAVECGCRIDGINKCGNYLSLDGAYLPIAKEGAGAELGVMEWCSAPGSKAECEGEVADGTFIATYIKTINP